MKKTRKHYTIQCAKSFLIYPFVLWEWQDVGQGVFIKELIKIFLSESVSRLLELEQILINGVRKPQFIQISQHMICGF